MTKIVEIDGGDLTTYSGNFDFYEKQRDLAAVQQQAQFERQQAMLAKEEAFIARFKAAREPRGAGAVFRAVKKLEKIDKVEPPRTRKVVAFDFRQPPRSGEDVAKLDGVVKGYGARKIYDGFTWPRPPPRALVRDGRQRRGQVDAPQARGRRGAA